MIQNYFKIAWRNLIRNKGYSVINIGGLAVGMAVAIIIGLWIYGEISFNKSFKNHDRIAQVMQHHTINDIRETWKALPPIMGKGLEENFGDNFEYIVQSSWNSNYSLRFDDKVFVRRGNFFQPNVIEMLNLNLLTGSNNGLKDLNSIMLSESVSEEIFGEKNPMGKILIFDNNINLKVAGVYKDLPENSAFKSLNIILPWSLFLALNPEIESKTNPWNDGSYIQTYVKLAKNVGFEDVSKKIKDIRYNKGNKLVKSYKPEIFLHPMSKWYLYDDFKNGINIGGRIDKIRWFGFIGMFILALACINFINLNTARSEKRAKEVGIRKAIGSNRRQLIAQFFVESILISFIAFATASIMVVLTLPYFNNLVESRISMLSDSPLFWITCIVGSLIIGLMAGFYPALYLSSFRAVNAIKGTFKGRQTESIPRQVLVISQFTISIVLIIGAMIVSLQINYATNRPVGYNKNGLISISTTKETHNNIDAIRSNLIGSRTIIDMAEASEVITEEWIGYGGWSWEGMNSNLLPDFKFGNVNYDYGKTIGWKIKEGRDFSRNFTSGSTQFILNESAVEYMNLKNPIGKTIKSGNDKAVIVGIVEDLIIESPYEKVKPTIFHLSKGQGSVFLLRLNPTKSIKESLSKVERVFKNYNPLLPFNAYFVDDEFEKKFRNEKLLGKLVNLFAIIAILISCLGLFGLASFAAEQRTKEIGIRKVVGASIFKLWILLSKDFVGLVVLSIIIASPIAYYLMSNWLNDYTYRTDLSFSVFLISGLGALFITLLTVSYQSIKTASANPIKSLKTE